MVRETRLQTQNDAFEDSSSGRAGGVERPNIEDIEGIYRLHSKRVYSLGLRMTGDSAEAQDLTQEAFLQLYRKLDTFRGESSFYTWFYRVCVNLVRAELRRKRRRMETSLDEMMESGCRGGARTARSRSRVRNCTPGSTN